MYALKPVFDLDATVPVPDCMYRLPVIQSSEPIEGVGGQEVVPSALAALSSRQDAILERLHSLQEQVTAYQKSQGLPTTTTTIKQSSTSSRLAQLKSTMATVEAMFGSSPSSRPVAPMSGFLSESCGRTPDLVVWCSASRPAHSLPKLVDLLQGAGLSVFTSCHIHSSIPSPKQKSSLLSFLPTTTAARATAQVRLTLIWTDLGRDCELVVSPITQSVIRGEVNVLRYLARLFPSVLPYETADVHLQDQLLDSVHSLAWAQPKDKQPLLRQFATRLTKSPYLAGSSIGASDLSLFSVIKQLGLEGEIQAEVKTWFNRLASPSGKPWSPIKRQSSPTKRKSESSPTKANKGKQGKAAGKDVKKEKKSPA